MALQFWQQYSKLTALQPPTGMILWLKGDNALYDGSNYIYSVPDSASGYDATQGVAVNQPLFAPNALNTHAVMRFDGSSDFMTGTTIPDIHTSSLDIFIVANGASNAGGDYEMMFGIGNYDNGLWIARYKGNQAFYVWNNGTYMVPAIGGLLPNTGYGYKIFEVWKNNAVSAKSLINNIQVASAVLGSFTNAAYYIGYGGLTYQGYYKGDIAEIIVYPSALSDTDREQVGAYLEQKYGLPFIVNKIPTMTSDTSPSGIVTYGHSIGGFLGWMAFDGDDTTYWNAGVNPNTFLCYQLPVAKIFTAYYIKSLIVGSYDSYSPTAWTIQASNNGIDWTVIDTQTGQSCQYGNSYIINNTLPFLYYKIVITAAQNNNPTIQTLMFS